MTNADELSCSTSYSILNEDACKYSTPLNTTICFATFILEETLLLPELSSVAMFFFPIQKCDMLVTQVVGAVGKRSGSMVERTNLQF